MGTTGAHLNEVKKKKTVSQEADSSIGKEQSHTPASNKESLRPDLKREYELFERYVRNFTGSSF